MTEEVIKKLCDEYLNWYYDSINDTCPEELSDAEDYLVAKTDYSREIVQKFQEKYREWIGYDMDCEFYNRPRTEHYIWIFNNWGFNYGDRTEN